MLSNCSGRIAGGKQRCTSPHSGRHAMDSEAQPTAALLRLAQEGAQRAARAIFDRYAARLACYAERHLSRKLAARLDGEDVVQSVFRTFFRRSAAGQFQIDGSNQLW